MDEPLLGSQATSNVAKFTACRMVSASIRLAVGLGLCGFVCFAEDSSVHHDYKVWFSYSSALLIVSGLLDFLTALLFRKQWLKSLSHIVALGSLCVNCALPVPVLLLLIFGFQLQARTPDATSAECTLMILALAALCYVAATIVLCEWKKVCCMCMVWCACCADTRKEENKP